MVTSQVWESLAPDRKLRGVVPPSRHQSYRLLTPSTCVFEPVQVVLELIIRRESADSSPRDRCTASPSPRPTRICHRTPGRANSCSFFLQRTVPLAASTCQLVNLTRRRGVLPPPAWGGGRLLEFGRPILASVSANASISFLSVSSYHKPSSLTVDFLEQKKDAVLTVSIPRASSFPVS